MKASLPRDLPPSLDNRAMTKSKGRWEALSLRHNFLWTLAGNVIYGGCQWGMVVVLAKLGSPEMVGQYALGIAVCTPVILLANLQLRGVQVTDAKRQNAFGDYLGLRLASLTLALLTIGAIVVVSGYRREIALVILVLALAKGCESVSDVFYGLLQLHERMDRIAISMMIKGPLSLLALAAGVYLTGQVLWGVVGLALVWALVLFSFDILNGKRLLQAAASAPEGAAGEARRRTLLRPNWDMGRLARLAWLALPLGVVMLLMSLNNNIPRYLIERYLGERNLGIFAALASLMGAGILLINALAESAFSRLAKHYAAENGAAFRRLLLKLLALGALIGAAGLVVVTVAGRPLLTILYRPEYGEHVDLLFLLMVVAAISYISSLLGAGITATRHFRPAVPLFALVTIIAAVSCFFLIPAYGLRGAALAGMLAAAVQAVGSWGILHYVLRGMK